jgi:hypothetical protein
LLVVVAVEKGRVEILLVVVAVLVVLYKVLVMVSLAIEHILYK